MHWVSALAAAEMQGTLFLKKAGSFVEASIAKVSKSITRVISYGFVARNRKHKCYSGISILGVTWRTWCLCARKLSTLSSDGTSSMLDIKRLSISVSALSSDENWYVMLEFDDIEDYKITAEAKK